MTSTAVEELESTIRDLRAEVALLKTGAATMLPSWDDRPDEWTDIIEAAFPTRSGSHDEYGIAMQMVGNRHSKYQLVALVNWLLVEKKAALATAGRLLNEDTAIRRALDASPHETTLQAAQRWGDVDDLQP